MNGLCFSANGTLSAPGGLSLGVSLAIDPGRICAMVGKNGAGKSSLFNAMSKKAGYSIAGEARCLDLELHEASTVQLARRGFFCSAQYPVELPGVSNASFLKAIDKRSRQEAGLPPSTTKEFLNSAKERSARLGLPEEFLRKGVNSEMSGGERKRNELLQMSFFHPKLVALDEFDSGLDSGALRMALDFLLSEQRRLGFAIIMSTHYEKTVEALPQELVDSIVVGSGKASMSSGASAALAALRSGFSNSEQVDELSLPN